MKIMIIIPARIGSERLPGKPLLKIEGKTMIARTAERALASGLRPVVLASDSELVLDQASSVPDLIPVLTSTDHKCGTERALEAYQILSKKMGKFDFIVNVQGDEPFISPDLLKSLPAELEKRKSLANCWTTVADLPKEELNDRNVAKVVLDMKQNALIFSRDPISQAYKHTSVYIYTPEFLEKFCALPPSPLEKAYSLEQMRALDNGLKINCVPLPHDSISINTLEDLEKAGVKDYQLPEPASVSDEK